MMNQPLKSIFVVGGGWFFYSFYIKNKNFFSLVSHV